MFFEITGPTGKTSYLLGTCHCVPLQYLHPAALQIALSCDTLVVESNELDSALSSYELSLYDSFFSDTRFLTTETFDLLPEMSRQAILFWVSKMNKFLDLFRSTFHVLPSDKQSELLSTFKFLNQDNFFSDFKFSVGNVPSWYFLSNIYSLSCYSGMDYNLLVHFDAKGRPIFPLDQDEIEEILIELYRNMSGEDLINAIKNLPESINETEQEYSMATIDYLNGKLQVSSDEADDFTQCKERNAEWLPKIIDKHSHEKNVLFAVGLAHLFGQHGLINSLQEEGFSIKKMGISGQFQSFTLEKSITNIKLK